MAFFVRAKQADQREPLPQPKNTSAPFFLPGWGAEPLPWVSGDNVIGIPAATYCLNLIARAVATIGPAKVYDNSDNEIAPTPLIVGRPVAGQSAYNVYSEIAASLLIHGNWVALPVDDQLVPLPMNQTRIYIDNDGYKMIEIGSLKYRADQVVHIAANTVAGSGGIGTGVVDLFRRSMGIQLAQQNFTANTYSNNGVPPAIVTIDTPEVTKEQAEAVRDRWTETHSRREVAVVGNKFKYETIAWNPEQMEFLASRQFSVSEMALMFGVSPGYLGASIGGTSLTYSNVQDRSSQFLQESVGPYLRIIEEGMSDALPEGQYAQFNVERYMRLTPTERDAHYTAAITGGWLTVDEVREIEHLPALGVPA